MENRNLLLDRPKQPKRYYYSFFIIQRFQKSKLLITNSQVEFTESEQDTDAETAMEKDDEIEEPYQTESRQDGVSKRSSAQMVFLRLIF